MRSRVEKAIIGVKDPVSAVNDTCLWRLLKENAMKRTIFLLTLPMLLLAQGAVAATKVINSSDLNYVGAFKVPLDNGDSASTLGYNGAGLAYNPAKNSLFISGHIDYGKVAEISIPTVVNSTNLDSLNRAVQLQGLQDITEGNKNKISAGGAAYQNGAVNSGGLLVYNNRLIGTDFGFYDANHEAVRSHFSSGLTLSQTGDFQGMYQLYPSPQAGFVAGPMAIIPAEYQAALGGKALTFLRAPSQNPGRSSYGPGAFAFNPDDLTGSSSTVINSVPLIYYDMSHQTLGAYDGPTNSYVSIKDEIWGIVFPENTKTVLFFGRHGKGARCYGTGTDCGDPIYADKGDHAYPYVYYVWAYDVDDLIAVKNGTKNPWDLVPRTWELNVPVGGWNWNISGAAYDSSTQRIYLLTDRGESPLPVINVLQLNISATADTVAPVVSVTSPASNASVSGTTSITATATDNVGVSKVEFYVNGTLQSTDTATPYIYSWDTSTLAAGTYSLMTKAYDFAGNVGQSAAVLVTVLKDTTAPVISLSSPVNNATVSGLVAIVASANDNIGVSKVEFYINGALISAGNVTPYSYNWNSASVANGSYTLTAKAYDASGNLGQTGNIIVTVNNLLLTGPGWTLTFQDEFNGTLLDTSKWLTTFTGGGTSASGQGEQEYYSSSMVSFPYTGASGYLQFNTSLRSTNLYNSGMINTYGKFSQTYGYFEMRAQIPSGQGMWPAFWLYNYKNPVVWSPPEIDVMEIGGGLPGTDYMSYHGPSSGQSQNVMTTGDLSLAYHTYAIDWEPGSITWYLDGVQKYQITSATVSDIPSTPMYILANLAIGGNWLGNPDSATIAKITANTVPMKIDYIRAYQKSSNSGYATIPGPTPIPSTGGSTTDTTSPTVSITSPAASATVSGTVTIAASASDNVAVSKVEFYANGTLVGTDTATPYSYSWNSSSVANGSYSITTKAYDAAGNIGQSTAVAVTVNNAVVDTTAPTASITSPAASATVSGTFAIAASASDNVAVSKVEFYVNGTLVGTDTAIPYSYSWNSSSVANGSYSITTKAYDAAGNIGQSAAVAVTVNNAVADVTAPTASITSPAASATVSGTVNISASASDNIAVSKVEFYVNGILMGTNTATPYTYSWNSTSVANGSSSLIVKAYDAAGNSSQSAAVAVTVNNAVVDVTAPTASITSPAAGTTVSGTVIISASASDNVSVSKVEFFVNGVLKATDTVTPYTYSWNSTSVASGSYALTVKAYDAAGNMKQSAAVNVTVKNSVADTTAPTVAITSPTANATISGTTCAAVSVSDNVGVTKVEYYVNGTLNKTITAAPFGFCVSTTAAYNGSYTMYAKAYDAAGNIKQSSSVSYKIYNR